MARVIEPMGPIGEASLPVRMKTCHPGKVPDAVTCAGSLININDSTDSASRPVLAQSDGSTWVKFVRESEVQELVLRLVNECLKTVSTPSTVDVTNMVRTAVRDMLPSLVPRANPVAIAPPENNMDDVRNCARALIELADEMSRQRDEINSLRSIIDNARFPVPEQAVARLS